MQITVSDESAALIRAVLESGEFPTAQAVVESALGIAYGGEELPLEDAAVFKAKLERSQEEFRTGRGTPLTRQLIEEKNQELKARFTS